MFTMDLANNENLAFELDQEFLFSFNLSYYS